jgi:hypothetical protein
MLLDLLWYKLNSMSQMLVIPHRFKKIGLHNLVVRRILSDILLVLGLKKVEKHWHSAYLINHKDNFTFFILRTKFFKRN